MRIRTVKPEFWSDQKVGCWDAETRLAFIWCWNEADDEGRMRLSPAALRSGAFMFHDMPIARAAQLLGIMCSSGRIIPYQANGETYGAILHFQDHQVINRPHPSRIPPPPDIPDHNIINDLSRMDHGSITTGMERNGIGMDQGKEGNGKGELEGEAVATLLAPTPKVEIKKMAKPKAADPLKRIRLNTETWAFEGIEASDIDGWKAAAPDVDIKRELNQLMSYAQTHEKWLRDRTKGGRWMVAIKAWMERAQGFSLTGGSGAKPPKRWQDDPTRDRFGREYSSVALMREIEAKEAMEAQNGK